MKFRKTKFLPDLKLEQKLIRQGYCFVVGLDEAGRGPLAGPVVAGAVSIDFSVIAKNRKHSLLREMTNTRHCEESVAKQSRDITFIHEKIANGCYRSGLRSLSRAKARDLRLGGTPRKDLVLRDSKKLSARQRERWYKVLTQDENIKWGVGVISQKIIDEINILEASKLAMKKALENLAVEPDFLLLDGNFLLEDLNISQKAIVSGDEKVISIAAASIIAKVTRDRLMRQYDEKFPVYGFAQHKGYGTKKHFETLKKYGPCVLHRFSFKPVKKLA